jgi:hypothetical protein
MQTLEHDATIASYQSPLAPNGELGVLRFAVA